MMFFFRVTYNSTRNVLFLSVNKGYLFSQCFSFIKKKGNLSNSQNNCRTVRVSLPVNTESDVSDVIRLTLFVFLSF